MDLLIARNPDPDSNLPYLLRLPLGEGLPFRAKDTWPRTASVYCHPVPLTEWPSDPEIVERTPMASCVRRGRAIDIVLTRGRENRSQLVFTTARGREVVFWNSARTRKQARPGVRTPTARAAGIAELEIIVDSLERYAYRFAGKPVTVVKRALAHGDYGVSQGGRLIAAVERKSLQDLATSLTTGKLTYALGGLAAAVPRPALVVEDRYSAVFTLSHVRPAVVADGLAELQVRYPGVPIVFCETRALAEEWIYRFLAAAHLWSDGEQAAVERIGGDATTEITEASAAPEPSTAEVRRWAKAAGLTVPDRGRLRPEIWHAWHQAHPVS